MNRYMNRFKKTAQMDPAEKSINMHINPDVEFKVELCSLSEKASMFNKLESIKTVRKINFLSSVYFGKRMLFVEAWIEEAECEGHDSECRICPNTSLMIGDCQAAIVHDVLLGAFSSNTAGLSLQALNRMAEKVNFIKLTSKT